MKDYKKILEGIVKIISTTEKSDIGFVNICDYISEYCPELRESEDEEIRKEIIDFINRVYERQALIITDEEKDSWITWLEKQGESTDINPSEFDLRLNKLLKQFETLPKEEFVNCLSFYLNVVQNNGTYKADEKQGEQKPTDKVESKFKVGDYVKNVNDKREPIYEIVYIDKECYICQYRGKEDIGDKAVMHFSFDNPYLRLVEQKPTDNVEPKFKIGDWVMLDRPVLITKVENMPYNTYQYWTSDGTWFGDATKAKLWTIKDAKNGDVLVNQNGEMPFIFKECKNNHIYCYCGYTNHKDIFFDRFVDSEGEELHWLNLYHEQVYPATKEQRDLLFQKMKEAGYKWDAEKKELKKIKQKPAEWSEEDEKMRNNLIRLLIRLSACTHTNSTSPSYSYPCEIDWLKSLKDRYTWKPSEEQLEALKNAIHIKPFENPSDSLLWGLYEQIKKLKEKLPK